MFDGAIGGHDRHEAVCQMRRFRSLRQLLQKMTAHKKGDPRVAVFHFSPASLRRLKNLDSSMGCKPIETSEQV